MKRLILVRHAKSSWKNPGLKDFARPLNGRGKQNAPMMGKRLLRSGILPEVVVSSPAKRAWSTARLIASEIHCKEENLIADSEIYEADVDILMEIIGNFSGDWQDVMLVGHNPGLTELAEMLTGQTLGNLPTCAICCIEFAVESWSEISHGSGRVYHYDYPKSIFSCSNN
ncbi:MAG: histidine phosphatase family protein [Desulfuromonadales bacterium]